MKFKAVTHSSSTSASYAATPSPCEQQPLSEAQVKTLARGEVMRRVNRGRGLIPIVPTTLTIPVLGTAAEAAAAASTAAIFRDALRTSPIQSSMQPDVVPQPRVAVPSAF